MALTNATCTFSTAASNYTAQPFNITWVADLIRHVNQTCQTAMLDSALGIVWIEHIRSLISDPGTPGILSYWYSPWNKYDIKIVLGRLIDYKLPLAVLIFQLPRAPLGKRRLEAFTLLHLVGSPVTSIAGLLYTFSQASAVLEAVRRSHRQLPSPPDEKDCEVLALVLIAYASIGMTPERNVNVINKEAIDRYLSLSAQCLYRTLLTQSRQVGIQTQSPENTDAFRKAARSLAADRRVEKVPVLAALIGFVAAVAIKYAQINHKDYDDDDPQAIGIWSLSSSLTVSWPIVAMFLACIIGVPKSEDSTRRILEQLEEDLNLVKRKLTVDIQYPIRSGAIPIYRPDRFRQRRPNGVLQITPTRESQTPGKVPLWIRIWNRFKFDICALLIVSTGPAFGIGLAALVPPTAWNCRTVDKFVMWGIYAVGWLLQIGVDHLECSTWLGVSLTAVVDFMVVVPFAWIIFITQFGLFNRLGCYTLKVGDVWGVLLPPFTWDIVQKRLDSVYLPLLVGAFILQFLICGMVLGWFWQTTKMYCQSDREPRQTDGELENGRMLGGPPERPRAATPQTTDEVPLFTVPRIGRDSISQTDMLREFLDTVGRNRDSEDKKGPEDNIRPVDNTP
ncbi:hypothetical protein QBC47DRAFT_439180 [Echria macrotheca]|uniref:Uncharacterized protein n=1 Tax=Echria macrotheca TaxID=438768 RepID=A0AAJ0B1R2_9PEZI|nr:hypothetical protein QBC47DRAFT_439180 [Echria macrotheca]